MLTDLARVRDLSPIVEDKEKSRPEDLVFLIQNDYPLSSPCPTSRAGSTVPTISIDAASERHLSFDEDVMSNALKNSNENFLSASNVYSVSIKLAKPMLKTNPPMGHDNHVPQHRTIIVPEPHVETTSAPSYAWLRDPAKCAAREARKLHEDSHKLKAESPISSAESVPYSGAADSTSDGGFSDSNSLIIDQPKSVKKRNSRACSIL